MPGTHGCGDREEGGGNGHGRCAYYQGQIPRGAWGFSGFRCDEKKGRAHFTSFYAVWWYLATFEKLRWMRGDLATRWAGRMVWVWKCFDRDKAATFYHVSVMVRVGASHSQRTKYLRFCVEFINDLSQAHPKGIVLVGEKHPKNGLKVGNLNLTKNCTKNNGPERNTWGIP